MGIWTHLLCRVYHEGKLLNNGIHVSAGETIISEVAFADAMGVSRKVMRRVLDVFVKEGMIEVLKRDRNGTYLSVCKWETYQSSGKAKGTETEQQRNKNETTTEHERDLNEHQSKSPKIPKSPKTTKKHTPLRFDDFWKAYPRKVGPDVARKRYLAACKKLTDTHDDPEGFLIERASSLAQAHKLAETKANFIPHPSTWLNEGRYKDDNSDIQPAKNAIGAGQRYCEPVTRIPAEQQAAADGF